MASRGNPTPSSGIPTPCEGSYRNRFWGGSARIEVKQVDASRVQATGLTFGHNRGSWEMSHLGGNVWGGKPPYASLGHLPPASYRWNVEAGGAEFVSSAPGQLKCRWVKADGGGTPAASGAAASSSAATSMPPLREACEFFKRELGVNGKSLVDVVDASCEMLGITDVKGVSLMQKAEKCWVCIKG